jgi:hypothetical protein
VTIYLGQLATITQENAIGISGSGMHGTLLGRLFHGEDHVISVILAPISISCVPLGSLLEMELKIQARTIDSPGFHQPVLHQAIRRGSEKSLMSHKSIKLELGKGLEMKGVYVEPYFCHANIQRTFRAT